MKIQDLEIWDLDTAKIVKLSRFGPPKVEISRFGNPKFGNSRFGNSRSGNLRFGNSRLGNSKFSLPNILEIQDLEINI